MGHLARLALVAAALAFALAAPVGAKAPNIVFILTDDLDAAAAAHMSQVKTLITDQGTSFRHHYVSLSMCCPSRVATLRGQFAHNTGVYTNNWPDGGFELVYSEGLERSTLATWLKDAGYRTALLGKYLNGYPDTAPSDTYVPPGWTEWMSPISGDPHGGFDYVMNHNGKKEHYGTKESDYLTDVLSAESANFIRRSVQQFPNQPFFLYVAPYTPHTPATPAPRHEKAFKNIQAPRTASWNEADVSDKPNWVSTLPLLNASQIKDIDKLYRKRRQTLLSIDDLVQNVVLTLQSTGQLNNTYVFFTSDNGPSRESRNWLDGTLDPYYGGTTGRLKGHKFSFYEGGIRVPGILHWPERIGAGQVRAAACASMDVMPTLLAAAGGAAGEFETDGRDLLAYASGGTAPGEQIGSASGRGRV